MSGWIKLHRALLDWEWYDDINVKVLFLHIMLRANHKDSKYKGHHVPAGSLVGGYPALAHQTNLSVRNVRTALKKLISTGEVTVKTTSKFSIIALNRWSDYQGTDSQPASQVTDKRQASDSQVTTSKEGKKKEGKKEEDKNYSRVDDEPSTDGGEVTFDDLPPLFEVKRANFEAIWGAFLKFNRKGDSKKVAFERYSKAIREGFTDNQIKTALRELATLNKKRAFGGKVKGFSTWLWKDNIQSVLDGENQAVSEVDEEASLMDRFFGEDYGPHVEANGETLEQHLLGEKV